MKKRLLAILLAALMIVSFLPTMAFAANGTSSTILTTNGLLPITENNEESPTWYYIAPDNAWENENGAKAFIGFNGSKYMLVFRLGEEAYDSAQISDAKSLFQQEDGYHLLWTNDESSLGFNAIFDINDDFTVLESIKVSGHSKEKLNGTYTAPVIDDCTYTQKVNAPENDKAYGLKLNGKDMGEFTFAQVEGGWSIKNADGKYLAMQDGKLVLSDTAFAWTYKNGAFSTAVKTEQKSDGHWFLFWYIPGRGSKTVTTTYYLNTVKDGEKLSTCFTCAEMYKTVTADTHDYKYVNKGNGTHDKVCKNCDATVNEECIYDEMAHMCVCGAYDPAESSVKISVNVEEKTSKHFVGWWFWGTWKDVTTYTATIKTEAKGVKVTKVQYQLNGGRWMTGTCASSDKPIETLNVKAWDSKGNLYEYEWPEGPAPTAYNVTPQVQGDHGTATVKVGAGEPTSETTQAVKGTSLVFTATPKDGYEFDYWEVVSGGIDIESVKNNAEITVTMPETALTLKAHFKVSTPAEYGIIVEDDGHGTASANPTSAAPETTVTLTATPDEGYAFKEWEIARGLDSITGNSFTMPSNEVKVKAIFERVYNINLQTNEHGTVTATVGGKTATTAAAAAEVTLTATPADGYQLKEWKVVSGGVSINDNKFTMPENNVTVQAVFEEIPVAATYTVTFDLNGITGEEPEAQTINEGDKVTKPADPTDTIHTFDGWYKTKDATTGKLSDKWDFNTNTVTEDITLYAQWTRTLGSIIATNPDVPTTDLSSDPPEDAWVNGDDSDCKAYIHTANDETYFQLFSTIKQMPSSLGWEYIFIKVNDNYELDSYGLKATCCMEGGKFVSFIYEDTWDDYMHLNGTYAPATVDKASYTMKTGNAWFSTLVSETDPKIVKNSITEIIFSKEIPTGTKVVDGVDLTADTTGKVKGYIVADGDNHKIYIVGDYILGNANCAGMFSSFVNLVSIDFGDFDTSNATNMMSMFNGCSKLTSLDLSKFDTSKVTQMNSMFNNCSGLESLDLSKFDTSSVEYMTSMFNGCSKLTSLDLSKFNTGKVEDSKIKKMFVDCAKLASVKIENENGAIKGQLGSTWGYASGAYTAQAPAAPLTIKFILGTASKDFPTSNDELVVPAGAWKTTDEKSCYIHSNYLVFNNGTDYVLDRSYNDVVNKTEEGYIYTNTTGATNPITFNMTEGVLTSITINGPEVEGKNYKGTYAPVAPAAAQFSVSASKKVTFSPGNLYWDGDSFEFEAKQYNYPSSWDANHVSHFYWHPNASVAYAENYGGSGFSTEDVFFTNDPNDAGKANSDFTVNGETGKYRTLSKAEWKYLISNRTVNGSTGEGKSYQRATINSDATSVYGLILYPDNYTAQTAAISYTSAEWTAMETAGCVFLPAAGYRDDSSFFNSGSNGYYWSANASYNTDKAFLLEFNSSMIEPENYDGGWIGFSVRLVTDVPDAE